MAILKVLEQKVVLNGERKADSASCVLLICHHWLAYRTTGSSAKNGFSLAILFTVLLLCWEGCLCLSTPVWALLAKLDLDFLTADCQHYSIALQHNFRMQFTPCFLLHFTPLLCASQQMACLCSEITQLTGHSCAKLEHQGCSLLLPPTRLLMSM